MSRVQQAAKPPYETRVQAKTLPALRSEESGRLDAGLIAKAFGMSLADVGRAGDRSRASIHKTPDAASLQKSLYSSSEFCFRRVRVNDIHFSTSLNYDRVSPGSQSNNTMK